MPAVWCVFAQVLEVFSGPPTVAFSWRHWANYTGTNEGHQGQGELVELFGFGVATVNDKLQLVDVDIYYKADEFLEVMHGKRPASDLAKAKCVMGPRCPVMAGVALPASEEHSWLAKDDLLRTGCLMIFLVGIFLIACKIV